MAFCPNCGFELRPFDKFCIRCGEKMDAAAVARASASPGTAAPKATAGLFDDYLHKLRTRLNTEGEYSELLGAYCFRQAQMSGASAMSLTKYHYHFYVRFDAAADAQAFADFSERCMEDAWALPHHNSLSLNTFAVPVLCQEQLNGNILQALNTAARKKTGFSFSLATYPVLLELSSGQLYPPTNTPLYGANAYRVLKRTVGETLFYRR